MSYFAEKRRKLDEETFEVYSNLHQALDKLITYVGQNLPKDAQEVLFADSAYLSESDIVPKMCFEGAYVLTKDGVKEVRRSKIGAKKPELEIKSIPTMDLITSNDDPDSFEKLCNNLQIIIEKHKIRIPKKYLVFD